MWIKLNSDEYDDVLPGIYNAEKCQWGATINGNFVDHADYDVLREIAPGKTFYHRKNSEHAIDIKSKNTEFGFWYVWVYGFGANHTEYMQEELIHELYQ